MGRGHPTHRITWRSLLSLRGLVIVGGAGLLIFGILWLSMGDRPHGPWQLSGMPDLAATGDLPPLSDVMARDNDLRARVAALGARDEGWIFSQYREVDTDIAAILLAWAGADMTKAGKTAEGLDTRVDTFLRKIYGFDADANIVGDPIMGENPWVRWFNHYKPRLLIQMAAKRIYDGAVTYDIANDSMVIEPRLSRAFFNSFQAFLATQPEADKARYINNLLTFIDSTVGLKTLPPKERKIVEDLMALRPKP